MSARVFVDTPVLCGHRGSGRGVGENTLPSFRAAVAAGLPWVEVDARLTADGVLVAYHEAVLPNGRYVSQLPAGETDEIGLMRVADLFEDLPPGIGVDVDMKSSLEDAQRPRGETTAALTADLVAPHAGRRPLVGANPANGYTTTASGSQVTVAGNISVNPISIDVLIGDV